MRPTFVGSFVKIHISCAWYLADGYFSCLAAIKGRDVNGQKGRISSIDVGHSPYSILSKSLPQVDIVFELIWMTAPMHVDEIPRCIFDVDRICILERYQQ